MGWPVFFVLIFFSAASAWADLSEIPDSKPPDSLSSSVSAEICRSLEDGVTSFQIGSRNERTEAGEELLRFYKDAQCRALWSDEKGIKAQALYMIHAIKQAAGEGLDIYDPAYNFGSILSLMGLIKSDFPESNPVYLAQLDILMTDAYMMLGKHLYNGVLPREEAPVTWAIAVKKPLDLGLRLRQAFDNNNFMESLEQLSPSYYGYQALKKRMTEYYKIQASGGWKTIEPSDLNGRGTEKYSLQDIRERLSAEGDLAEDNDSVEAYRNALKNFQQRHGIKADGIVGKETLSKLNIPLEDKIAMIRLNMERWRWMPENLENSYITVNISDFLLSVIDGDATVLKMKAILGRKERPTPIFNALLRYIVVNPYWRVPDTILQEDIFPEVRKNILYLKKERIRIFKKGDDAGKEEINPAKIDWENADADTFSYFLRQDSGEKNVLGRLKFIFPNPYDIYIHDTPGKYLFENKTRAFSSGCIRIEEPVKLAEYLLENDGNGEHRKSIADLIAMGGNKNIFLSEPVKVYINYWTVWVDDAGMANFRDDVYDYDRYLAELLGWNWMAE